jgi:hypothetical protein
MERSVPLGSAQGDRKPRMVDISPAMTQSHELSVIRRWFDLYRCGSLVLPDRWFGRPYDNAHRLTRLEERDGNIIVTLDDHVTITLYGVGNVASSDAELLIGPCDRIRVEWVTYDESPEHGSADYSSGSVKVVRFPAG